MAEFNTDVLDNVYFDELLRSSITDVLAEDDLYFDDSIFNGGTIRLDVEDFVDFVEVLVPNMQTLDVYDVIEFDDELLNGGTLRWDIEDDILFEEDYILGKELSIALEDTIHLSETGHRTYESSPDDTLSLTDTALKVQWEDVIDSLTIDDIIEADTNPHRTDALALTDVATFKLVRTRPISDALAITDVAAGWLENLTKEYQPQ